MHEVPPNLFHMVVFVLLVSVVAVLSATPAPLAKSPLPILGSGGVRQDACPARQHGAKRAPRAAQSAAPDESRATFVPTAARSLKIAASPAMEPSRAPGRSAPQQ